MPLYTGDYIRDTRHLTPLKHGIYLLALMHCWDSKGPMPLDEQESAGICNCRSADEIEAMRYVLGRFFVRMVDGHYNKRLAEEVGKAEDASNQARDRGMKSAEARRQKYGSAQPLPSSRNAFETLSKDSQKAPETHPNSPSPSPSPSQKKEETQDAPRKRSAGPAKPGSTLSVEDLKAEGIDEQQARDWLKVRKDKRLPLTQSAWDGIKAEIDRASITPAEAIAECNTRGWGGFRADWYAKDSSSQASNGHGIL